MPVQDGDTEHSCGRCAQVEELLRLLAELREEVGRQKSIRESENKINWWGRALLSLRQAPQPATATVQETKDSLPLCHQIEGWDLKDRGVEAGSCLAQQVNLPCFTFPGASMQQV